MAGEPFARRPAARRRRPRPTRCGRPTWSSRVRSALARRPAGRCVSSDGMRALPPRNPNETQPSFVGQISRVRPMLAPARFAWTCDRNQRPAPPMLATSTVSCIDRSTSTGRTPDAERGQRRERDLRRGVRVRGIARAADRRAVGIAGAVQVARGRHHAEVGRPPRRARAGRSERRHRHPHRLCRVVSAVVARRDHDVGRRSHRRIEAPSDAQDAGPPSAVGLDSTRSATDTPSRREPDTRVRLRSRHVELPHRVR